MEAIFEFVKYCFQYLLYYILVSHILNISIFIVFGISIFERFGIDDPPWQDIKFFNFKRAYKGGFGYYPNHNHGFDYLEYENRQWNDILIGFFKGLFSSIFWLPFFLLPLFVFSTIYAIIAHVVILVMDFIDLFSNFDNFISKISYVNQLWPAIKILLVLPIYVFRVVFGLVFLIPLLLILQRQNHAEEGLLDMIIIGGLGWWGNIFAVDSLIGALGYLDREYKGNLISSLFHIGPVAVPKLCKVLERGYNHKRWIYFSHEFEKECVIEALSIIGGERAASAIWRSQQSPKLVEDSMVALGISSVRMLEKFLMEFPNIHERGIEILKNISSDYLIEKNPAREVLQKIAQNHKNEEVRKYVAGVLQKDHERHS